MDKSANKIRGRRPLDKQTVDITLGITIIIYLLPKQIMLQWIMDPKIWILRNVLLS